MHLLCLLPGLVSASVGEFRWSTPYPDGRTQDLLAVVSPTEFFMAASKISGINHFNNGVWSWIPPPPDIPADPQAKCIATRLSGSKVMVIVAGDKYDPTTYNEYSVGAQAWSQTSLLQLQADGELACFMTNTALFLAGTEVAVYDIGVSLKSRVSTNLCNITSTTGCNFIAGNSQVVYTFTGPPENTHLLRYDSTNWVDVGQVNLTLGYIESLALASDGTIYAAGNGVLVQSKDGGQNWTQILTVSTTCSSPNGDVCNQAIYAANNVVLLGSFSSAGLYGYNLSNGVALQRNFSGRAIVAGGIANTAFVMGAYGAVWQTAMIADAATPVNQLTKGLLVDYYPAGTGINVCQVQAISGSAAMGKVYAVTSGCGEVGSVYSSSIPAANIWTRIGPAQSAFSALLTGIFALPLSDDIWVWSSSDLVRYQGGSWGTVRNLGSLTLVTVHGHQDTPVSSSVFLLFTTQLAKITTSTSYSLLVTSSANPFAALYVHNSTLLFLGDRGCGVAVSTDGGVTKTPGTNSFFPGFFRTFALYYSGTTDVIWVAADNGLWQSVGGVSTPGRTWIQVMAGAVPLNMSFDSIWARNDNDIYVSGDTLNVIWHFSAGVWEALSTPLDPEDSYFSGNIDFGVRGIWGTAAGDTYAGTRVGVISSPVDTPSPTMRPSPFPTPSPTSPTPIPTSPTHFPSTSPSFSPTSRSPTPSPTTLSPTPRPTHQPTVAPTHRPTKNPVTQSPSMYPTSSPSESPTLYPTFSPSPSPTSSPSRAPSPSPTIRECLCLDDCEYKGIALGNNGVCEDAGPGGNGYEYPELAACVFGHDCTDCGTANRTAYKNPISCVPTARPYVRNVSGASTFSVFVPCVFVLVAWLL